MSMGIGMGVSPNLGTGVVTGPIAPFLIDEDFTVDPSWTATGNSNVTGGELVSITTGGSEDFQTPPTYANQTEIWFEYDLTFDTGFTITNFIHTARAITIRDGTAFLLSVGIIQSSGLKFVSEYRGDAGTTQAIHSTPTLVLGQEYKITGHWKQNSGVDVLDGVSEIWIDGVKALDIPNIDNDTRLSDSIQLGLIGTSTTVSGTDRIDNIRVSNIGISP